MVKEKNLAEKRAEYEIIGKYSDEQITMLKHQNGGKIMEIVAYDDMNGEAHIAYIKRPTMETLSAVNAVSKTDEMKASNTMFDNCFLGGSAEFKTDAILRMGAMTSLSDIFSSVTSTIKNL